MGEKGVVKFNLNKELKDMTSFETEAKDGNKAKLDQSGLTVGDKTQLMATKPMLFMVKTALP
ncbi:hypothetical protein JFL59_02750 [Histophilus somni]|uniref:hypothetical protein n=1 Tax=Histophilus somni TaxID=731 RepID=UPI0018ECD4D1|nr:hypothetical protein [Histophilus somni]QQF70942.1 hypothetical protein JFL59_02750 [Histophilus somni]